MDSPDALIGQVIADRYRVISMLGEGGMGRVYLAEHVRMRRQCAVKVISPALASTEAAVARFNREAENASQISHPNVVQVYDFGEGPNHSLYLAMEYIQGETLTARIRREGPFALGRAAAIVKQVADALSAAHHRGIIHRDLKPDNILVTRHFDGSELVKVCDFGIAKAVQDDSSGERGGQTLTTVGVSIGTPDYMSPEQLSGERLDTRTDLYSLGLVFFNVLTGELPFPPVTSRENLIRRLMSPPRTLRDARPAASWPESVQRVLDRALALELSQRYATAGEFARDLSAIIAAAPVESEVTIPLRSAGAAAAFAPTAKERAPAAPTITEKFAPPAVAESVGPTAPRGRGLIVGALIVVAIAGAAFALYRKNPPPPVTAALPPDTVSHSVKTAAPIDSAPQKAPASAPPVVAAAPKPAVDSTAIRPKANVPASAPAASPTARIDSAQRSIDQRITVGRQALIGGEVIKARAEFREAVQEVASVLSLSPADPAAHRLRDSVARSLRGVVIQCQNAIQRRVLRVPDPNFKCGSLVPPRFLGRGRS